MEKKEYTMAEVAVNNGENGTRVWIILWGTVYDVTDYMAEHPGGSELITEYAGGDATSGFDDFGHSSDAKKMLKKYEVGFVSKNKEGKNKEKQNGVNFGDVDPISMKRQDSRQRRKFLSLILGPCASG